MKTAVLPAFVSLAVSLIPAVSHAGPAELEEIRRGCMAQIGARCDCIVQSATSLTDREQAYVAAMFSQDPARLQPLVMSMSQTELGNANGFLRSSALACTSGAR